MTDDERLKDIEHEYEHLWSQHSADCDCVFCECKWLLSHIASLQAELASEREVSERHAADACELRQRMAEAESRIESAYKVLLDSPEINPSNYNHDDVCKLNNGAIEAYMILRPEASDLRTEKQGADGSHSKAV